jgi:large subunit ribosomal protein L9
MDITLYAVGKTVMVNIKPENLHLPNPLKSLGEYEVPLRLPRDIPRPEGKIQWILNVKIRRK